jgi:P27 family predicted phage terminase small subunit
MPPRQSNERKRAAGTFRPDRNPRRSPIEPLGDAPSPPGYLSAGAKREWGPLTRVLVDLGVIVEADLRSLALLCEVLASEAEYRAQIARDGALLIAPNGTRRANPIVKMLEASRNQAARMLSSFGLDPKGRQGVDLQPREPEGQPKTGLAKFL